MIHANRAIRRRLVVMAALGLLVAVLGLDPVAAQNDPGGSVGTNAVADGQLALPDVVVLVASGTDVELHLASVAEALSGRAGIAWVAPDPSVTPAQILVGLVPDAEPVGLRSVEATVAGHPAAADLTVAGRVVVDRDLLARTGRGVLAAGLMATLLVAVLVAWRSRPIEGVVAGGAVGLSALLASAFTPDAAGRFDGSIITTSVPVVVSSILVATFLVLRLLLWFNEPEGEDQAEVIHRSVGAAAVELALFGAGLAVVAIVLGVVGPGRSAAVGILFGSLVAVAITLATVPSALVALAGGSSQFSPFSSVFPGPDGRQFPSGMLVGVGAVLGLLALLSFQATSAATLLDERSSGEADPALLAGAGDPTAAIVARFPAGVDQQARTAWVERVSQLPGVARVDTATARYVDGAPVDQPAGPVLARAGIDQGDEVPNLALVLPDTASRAQGAQDLVASIEATSASVDPELTGPAVDAAAAAGRDGLSVWLLIVILAIISSAAVFGLIGDPVLAALAGGLRLLGSAAAVGLYQLLGGEPTGSELQLLVLLLAAGCALFELGVLRHLLQRYRGVDHNTLITQSLEREGWAAAMGLVVAGAAGLGLALVDLAAIRRFGLLLAVAAMVEVMVGMWLLRPPVLGLRAVHHLATQPVRAALAALLGGGGDARAQSRWSEVVLQLLRDEFALQSAPDGAGLDDVFVPGTALHRKAIDHHRSLTEAGLRILGREPRLRTVRVVGGGPQTAVAVTVDHPPRQLVDPSGTVLGVRKPERRSLMLWLEDGPDGRHRIADTVELGVEPLGEDVEPAVAGGLALGATVDPLGG